MCLTEATLRGQHMKVLPEIGVCFCFSLIMRKIYSELVATIVRTNKSVFRYCVYFDKKYIKIGSWLARYEEKKNFKA